MPKTPVSPVHSALSLNLDSNILAAALPLLEAEKVEAIEWSFDALFALEGGLPDWFEALLAAFSAEKRLVGHGVFFSLFSGKWLLEQADWLKKLEKTAKKWPFDHVTEHFGFLTGADFHSGAPLGAPFSAAALRLGRDRLARIQAAAGGCAVGLENLAFAYSIDEAKRHGAFLEALVAPQNGFIILDLHNFYCQMHNFEVSAEALFETMPLERVREIHVSGGSWSPNIEDASRKIRRDTHDDAVPSAVFELLETAIEKCENLKFVVLEQLGPALADDASRARFQADFLKMRRIVRRKTRSSRPHFSKNDFLPPHFFDPKTEPPAEDSELFEQQTALSEILENAPNEREARRLLEKSSLAATAWEIEKWQPAMLQTAIDIAQKWKNGW